MLNMKANDFKDQLIVCFMTAFVPCLHFVQIIFVSFAPCTN